MNTQILNRWASAEISKYGLTKFADMLGLSHSSVRSWKTAKVHYLKDTTLEKIAVYMDCTVEEVRQYFGMKNEDPIEQLRYEVKELRDQVQDLKELLVKSA